MFLFWIFILQNDFGGRIKRRLGNVVTQPMLLEYYTTAEIIATSAIYPTDMVRGRLTVQVGLKLWIRTVIYRMIVRIILVI